MWSNKQTGEEERTVSKQRTGLRTDDESADCDSSCHLSGVTTSQGDYTLLSRAQVALRWQVTVTDDWLITVECYSDSLKIIEAFLK